MIGRKKNIMNNATCYSCGHTKQIATRKPKCSRCGSPPTQLITYENKHKQIRQKVTPNEV
jgi:ribosomal protein L37E